MHQTIAALPGLSFHHFGLAVGEPDEAFRYLRALGYVEGNQVYDERQRVNLAMRHHAAMPDVEVIWPGTEPSPIDKLIKRMGTMIYHVCYTCPDPDVILAAIGAAGVETVLVSPRTPAVLFGGQEVSFYSVAGFGLIEFLHTGPER